MKIKNIVILTVLALTISPVLSFAENSNDNNDVIIQNNTYEYNNLQEEKIKYFNEKYYIFKEILYKETYSDARMENEILNFNNYKKEFYDYLNNTDISSDNIYDKLYILKDNIDSIEKEFNKILLDNNENNDSYSGDIESWEDGRRYLEKMGRKYYKLKEEFMSGDSVWRDPRVEKFNTKITDFMSHLEDKIENSDFYYTNQYSGSVFELLDWSGNLLTSSYFLYYNGYEDNNYIWNGWSGMNQDISKSGYDYGYKLYIKKWVDDINNEQMILENDINDMIRDKEYDFWKFKRLYDESFEIKDKIYYKKIEVKSIIWEHEYFQEVLDEISVIDSINNSDYIKLYKYIDMNGVISEIQNLEQNQWLDSQQDLQFKGFKTRYENSKNNDSKKEIKYLKKDFLNYIYTTDMESDEMYDKFWELKDKIDILVLNINSL